jgi:WD40 repeat protein
MKALLAASPPLCRINTTPPFRLHRDSAALCRVEPSQRLPSLTHQSVARRRPSLTSTPQPCTIIIPQVWNLADCRKVATLRGHERSILTLRVHLGRLYSSAGCTVKIWSLTTYECETSLHWGPARCGEILSVATCGNWLYAGFRDGVVRSVLIREHDDNQPTTACGLEPVSDGQIRWRCPVFESTRHLPDKLLVGRWAEREGRSQGAHGFQKRTSLPRVTTTRV